MAQLQGHFLTYRDDPETQVSKAKEITREDTNSEDMSILEFL